MKQWFIVLLSFLLASLTLNASAQNVELGVGQNSDDRGNAVVTDAAGNVYVTGSVSGNNVNFGNSQIANSAGGEDLFLAKYNAAGVCQWVRTAGSTSADRGRDLVLDNQGNIYVVGFVAGQTSFPNFQLNSNGGQDALIAKYDVNGGFQWAANVGGAQSDQFFGVDVDNNGNVYVIGHFQGSFNINTVNGTQTVNGNPNDYDVMYAKLNGNGQVQWIQTAGGNASDQGWSVQVQNDNVYVTGYFSNTATFMGENGNIAQTSAGDFDVYLADLNMNTGLVEWVQTAGGLGSDYGHKLETDAFGGIYLVGRFEGIATFNGTQANTVTASSNNSSLDAFVAKYNSNGAVEWVSRAGGTRADLANSVAINPNNGNIYVTGQFQTSFNFANGNDPNFVVGNAANGNSYDIFLAEYDQNGSLLRVEDWGGRGTDVGSDVFFSGGRAVITGYFAETLFKDGVALFTSRGSADILLTNVAFEDCNLPVPTVSAGTPSGCAQTLTAGNFGVFGNNLQWFRNGQIINGATEVNYTANQSGTYTVRIIDGGCQSVSASATVNISNNLFLNATATPSSINLGQSTSLNATVSGNVGSVTYTWRDINNNVVSNNQTVSVSPSQSTTYNVTATDNANGCATQATVSVTVINNTTCPTEGDVSISIIPGNDNVTSTAAIAEICQGQSTGLQAVGFIGNTGFSYSWVRFNEVNQPILVRSGSPIIESITIEGNYALNVTAPGCPEVQSNTIFVDVFPIPRVSGTANQQPGVCNSDPVQLTGFAQGGTPFSLPNADDEVAEDGYKYRWEPIDAIVGNNIRKSVTANPTIATTYTVTVEDRITCGNSTTVSVNPGSPDVAITPGPISLCTGASTTLSVTSVTLGGVQQNIGAYTYQWYNGNTPIAGATGSSLLVTGSGNYRAQIIANVAGCPNKFSNETFVSFTAAPVANAGADRSVCVGQTVVLGTTPVAGFTYSWSPSVGLSNPNSANPSFVASALGTTIYTVTVSSANCPPAADQVAVTVSSDFPAPVISAQGPTQLCQGQAVNLQVDNFDPTVSYSWSRNGVSLGQSGTIISVTTAGTYTVTASGNTTCGAGVKTSNPISVTFTANPIANAGPDRNICEGQSTRIGVPAVPGVSYSWAPFDGFVTPNGSNESNPVVRPAFTTTYTVSAFAGNCPGTSDVVTVTVTNRPPAPQIVADGPTDFCAGGTVNLSITNYDPNVYVYEWYNNGFRIGQSGPSITVARTGNFYAEARVIGSTNSACNSANSNTIRVTVTEEGFLPVPKIYPFGSANIGICGENVTVWTDWNDNYTYQWWKDGDIIPGATDTSYVVTEPGIYHIQVIFANCVSKKSEGLFVTETPEFRPTVRPLGSYDQVICAESNVCVRFVADAGHEGGKIADWWFETSDGTRYEDANLYTSANMDTARICDKPINDGAATYTAYVRNEFGCVAETSVTVTFKFIGDLNLSTNVTCQSEAATLTADGGFNFYRWFFRSNPNATWDEFDTIPGQTGEMMNEIMTSNVGQYYVEASIEGCPKVRSNEVNVEFSPDPTISNFRRSSSSVICAGSQATFTGTALRGSADRIFGADEFGILDRAELFRIDENGNRENLAANVFDFTQGTASQSFSFTITPDFRGVFDADTITYEVVVTNENGCSASATASVIVVGAPGFGVTGPGTICSGSRADLSVTNPSAYYSYRWEVSSNDGASFGNLTTNSTGGATSGVLTSVNSNTSRTYIFRAYARDNSLNPCNPQEQLIGEVFVQVDPVPTTSITAFTDKDDETRRTAIEICYTESFDIYRTSTPNPTNVVYNWTRTSMNNMGESVTEDLFSEGVTEDFSNRRNLVQFADEFAAFYPDTNGVYTYTLTATVPGTQCSVSDAVTVTVGEFGPHGDAWPSHPVVCQGQDVTLYGENKGQTASQITGRSNSYIYYRWYGPTSLEDPVGLLSFGTVSGNNRSVPGPTVTPERTTTYTLTLTSPYNNCVSTCEVEVEVGPRLVATVQNVEGRDNLCEGPITLRSISNSTNADVRYQWYTDSEQDDIWTPIPGATSDVFMPSVGGRYNVRVYNEDYPACYDDADNWQTLSGVRGGEMEANDLITVKKADYLHSDMQLWEVQTKPVVICPGQSVELRARYIFGASYQWYRVTGPSSMPNYEMIAGANTRSYIASGSGKYKVMVTAGCFDCPDVCETWSQTCPVVQIPELKPTVHHVGQINFCENDFVKLYTQGNEDQYNYQWYRNGVEIEGANMKEYIVKSSDVETGGTQYSVVVGSKYVPVDGSVCHAMSENDVTIFPCHEVLCPEPTSLRAIPVEKDLSAVIIRWDKPLQNSLYQLTDEYELRWRRVGTTVWTTRIVRDMYEYKAEGLAEGVYEVQVRSWCVDNTQSLWHPEMPVEFVIGEGTAPANCAAVNSVIASVNADGSVNVSWSTASGTNVSSYDVFYRLAGGTSADWILAGNNVTGNSFTLSSDLFQADQNYEAGVVTNCDGGLNSADIASNVFGGLCNAVVEGSVSVENVTQTSATISWDEPAGNPGSYIVQYTTNPSFPAGTPEVSTNVESVTLTGLNPGTQYFYRIVTNCSNAPSVELPPFQTLDATGTGDDFRIRWVVNQTVTSNTALILWDTNNDSENYSLRYRIAGSSDEFTVVDRPLGKADSPFQIDGLLPSTEYVVNINANDPSNPNNWTADLLVLTLGAGDQNQTPTADGPARIVCDGNNILVDIAWQDVPGAIGYQVEWKEINAVSWFFETDGENQSIIPNGQNFYTIQDGITPNDDFYVRIRAVFPDGNSEWTYILINETPDCAEGKVGNIDVASNNYNVYPNPNNGLFNVSFDAANAGDVTVKMMDVTGKAVFAQTFEAVTGANQFEVAATDLSAGIYMVQIINAGEVNTTKVIVE